MSAPAGDRQTSRKTGPFDAAWADRFTIRACLGDHAVTSVSDERLTAPGMTRRRLLATIGTTVLIGGAVPLAGACSLPVPVPGAGPAASGKPAPAANPANALPTYMPSSSGPKPDFPATGPLYQDGYASFPKNPTAALPST